MLPVLVLRRPDVVLVEDIVVTVPGDQVKHFGEPTGGDTMQVTHAHK